MSTTFNLQTISQQLLDYARAAGASDAEVEISKGNGLSVNVRLGEVETIEHTADRGASLTVYVGTQRGHASTGDFSAAALKDVAQKAVTIARQTEADPFAGLADRERLATQFPDLDLYHPWDLDVDTAVAHAREAEKVAMAVDKRINNSEGASMSVSRADFIYANTLGFMHGFPSTRHGLSVSVLAEDDEGMQRDYWYTSARAQADLDSAEEVGRIAGKRTVSRLGSRSIASGTFPVIFEAPVAGSLWGAYVNAVSGSALYRKTTFLPDSLGQQVFPNWFSIEENPLILRGAGSTPYDDEGVAPTRRFAVKDGKVNGYFLGSYSARKLGMTTTGNSGGNHNLLVSNGSDDLAGLVKRMGRGLLVTEMMGQGVNSVTGDYSRGAAGFWVEGGEIAYPVHEITIASNLKDMFRNVVAVGNDVELRATKVTGSVWVSEMQIAGQ